MISNGNRPAYPCQDIQADGLTLRELFSAMAMEGLLASGLNVLGITSAAAVRHADALLAELEKGKD